MGRRQHQDRFGLLQPLDDLDPIEIGYAGADPANLGLAGRVHDDPEIAPEPIVRRAALAGGAISRVFSRPLSAVGCTFQHPTQIRFRHAENCRCRANVAVRPQRHHRDRHHVFAAGNRDVHLRIHAGHEQSLGIVDGNKHREHGYVLFDHRLRLDFDDLARERLVRIGRDGDLCRHAGTYLADVRLVDERPNLHLAQVRHLHQRAAAGNVAGRRRDHLPALHRFLDHGASDRCAHVRIVDGDACIFDAYLGRNHVGLGIGKIECSLLEVELGEGTLR